MISDDLINTSKQKVKYKSPDPHHEHNDCIRIAYEWLDAQKKTKNPAKRGNPLKHIIEKWGGRYVSTSDVEVAAFIHPDITGTYPYYNISSRLTEPSTSRIDNLAEAFTHNNYREHYESSLYKIHEDITQEA